jgi:hypothetical protein
MQTKTCAEPDSRALPTVAPRASPFPAVHEPARRPVVPRADNALFPHQHAPYPPLHTVAALCGQARELHEVLVPAGAQPVRVREVELAERGVEVREGGGGVEEADRGAGYERL